MTGWRVELNQDSAAWANVFLNNKEIKNALQEHGNALAKQCGRKKARVKKVNYTQIAVIRNIKQSKE